MLSIRQVYHMGIEGIAFVGGQEQDGRVWMELPERAASVMPSVWHVLVQW